MNKPIQQKLIDCLQHFSGALIVADVRIIDNRSQSHEIGRVIIDSCLLIFRNLRRLII
jgi:hypothetical protein